jgi:hypothetical protein
MVKIKARKKKLRENKNKIIITIIIIFFIPLIKNREDRKLLRKYQH